MAREYVIRQGDTFYKLAQKMGGTWEEWVKANPGLNPGALQVGQKVVCPYGLSPARRSGSSTGGSNCFAQTGTDKEQFSGEVMDELQIEVEGLKFSIRRVGEMSVPHEVQLILPRTEIRKIQPVEGGPCEVQIMLSNINLVHSPRLMSADGNPLAQAREITGNTEDTIRNRMQTVRNGTVAIRSGTPTSANEAQALRSRAQAITSGAEPPTENAAGARENREDGRNQDNRGG